MFVHRSASRMIARAPAKLNLFFEVLGKRDDGFHEIETLMIPVTLYDVLSFESDASGRITLDCGWADLRAKSADPTLGVLPPSEQNIVVKAVALLRDRAGVEQGARLRLIKRIPAAAGLGGGSSDAAAALLAANLGWNLNWSRERLAKLAAELGSDVPFFLAEGAAICRGRGERVEPVGRIATLHAVVVRPPAGLSTVEVYAACAVTHKPHAIEPLVQAVARADRRGIARHLHNRLEQPAASRSPWVSRLRREFQNVPGVCAQLTGSGTAYFGICRSARHARRVAAVLRARKVGRVYQVRSC